MTGITFGLRRLRRMAAAALVGMAGAAPALAQQSIDEKIDQAVRPVADKVTEVIFYPLPLGPYEVPFVLVWLIVSATIFTLYFRFINVRALKHGFQLVRGDYDDPEAAGEVTHFQALATALSGTVGLGNIAGVAVAVSLGGPGATFWMIAAGLCGMAAKFTECSLGVKYREEFSDGRVSGGPMYYLSKGLAEKGKVGFGKVIAALFAVMCIFGCLGGGNMFQGNQAHQMIANTFGIFTETGWLFGLILALIVGAVIIGGIKSIARVTEKIVPLMAILYVGTALIILIANIGKIPWAFGLVIKGAFAPTAITGGIVGVLIQGLKRAAFSNEAGVGSAAIAHSAVKTNEPLTEGYVALLEPFIDTVVICTMTALVIVITGAYGTEGLTGVALTSSAFQSVFPWFGVVLAIAVLLFAFSTMISWSYYGLKSWTYLFGEGKTSELIFKIIFCVFVVIGCSMSLGPVIDFSDAAIFAMSIFNVIGLYMLMGSLREDLKDYQDRVASGEIKRYK
jgi:AGCS family alanine or glycine:cation symporter